MDTHVANTTDIGAKTPWLSVIIPIYNAEKHLKACLDSIAMQSEGDFEVILVDDGSTDRSCCICRDYAQKDGRFRYIQKANGGAYQTRIFGAEQANGTYVTFCDADDYYTSRQAFQILRRHLSHRNYDVIQFGYEKKFNHLKQKKPCVAATVSMGRDEMMSREYPRLLCSYWDGAILTTNVWNKVYHRRLLTSFPSSDTAERIFWGDDLIMNLHLMSTGQSLLFIPEVLYGYRQLSGGTSKFSNGILKDLDQIKKYQLHYLDRYEGEAGQQIRSTLFAEAAAWFYHHIQQALKHLSEPEVETMILETLQLPSFIRSREYYLHQSDCDWEAVELLRKADPKEYIAKAKVFRNQNHFKDSVRSFLAKIYAAI